MSAAESPRINEERVIALRVDKIIPSKTNPRPVKKDAALLDLAQDIVNRGVQVPIVVRSFDKEGADYEIVVGARRHLASKIAKLTTIPAIVRELSDDQAFELQIIENMQREDMHPLDEAEAIKKIFDRTAVLPGEDAYKLTAARLGKATSFIAQRLKLNGLIPKAKESFRKGEMLLGHANEIARLEPDGQAECVKFLSNTEQVQTRRLGVQIAQHAVSVEALRVWIRGSLMLDLAKAPFDTNDATLSKDYGACTTCPHRTSNSPNLFGDVGKGDLCTVPADFFHKVNVNINRHVAAAAKERGVAKLVRVGYGSHWGNPEKLDSHIPVDAYVGEHDSKAKLVAKGDECNFTQPGIVVYKARNIDVKLYTDVSVCMAAVDGKNCEKHKNRNGAAAHEAAPAPRDKPEARDAKRIAVLKAQVPVLTRDAVILEASLKAKKLITNAKLNGILGVAALQMRTMLYGDRHRELAKNVFRLDPKKFKNKNPSQIDYQWMVNSVLDDQPLPWLVACACMNGGEDAVDAFVKHLAINEKKIAAEVKADINEKIEAIKATAKRRTERGKAKPKAKTKKAKK
jgi:ParB/RepB/Spo0J family partition protein